MEELIFYGLAVSAVLSACCVITAANPVHSVLYLILVFVLNAGILLLLKVEFLAIVLVVVYVGAIAVLFLFVVMMLNVRLVELQESLYRYLPVGGVVAVILFLEIVYILRKDVSGVTLGDGAINWFSEYTKITNMEILSQVLYTYYVYYFMLAGLILLVSMFGTIVLTLHHEMSVKRQEIYKQVCRDYRQTIKLKK